MSMESHVTDCLDKMKDSRRLVTYDVEVHDIIVEMASTVVRSCSVALKTTADKIMAATLVASELVAAVSNIIVSAEEGKYA